MFNLGSLFGIAPKAPVVATPAPEFKTTEVILEVPVPTPTPAPPAGQTFRGIPVETWRTLDWDEKNITISKRLGVREKSVSEARLRYGKRKSVNWRQMRWFLSDEELAAQLKLPVEEVARNRQRLLDEDAGKFAPGTRRHIGVTKPVWKTVDWSRSTGEIGRMLGATAPSVSNARMVHAPETMKANCKRKPKRKYPPEEADYFLPDDNRTRYIRSVVQTLVLISEGWEVSDIADFLHISREAAEQINEVLQSFDPPERVVVPKDQTR